MAFHLNENEPDSALAKLLGIAHGWEARARLAERKLDAIKWWALTATLTALAEGALLYFRWH